MSLALVLLFAAGFLELSFNSMAQTLVQLNAPVGLRGRVIGLFNMASLGLRAFSGVSVGLVGSLIGVHRSLALSALIMLVVAISLLRVARQRSAAIVRRFRCGDGRPTLGAAGLQKDCPMTRQLHLGAFMRPASIHTGAWRYPGAWPDMNFNLAHIKQSIQALERAKFDAFFMADHMAVLNMPMDALKRSHTSTSFEPFTLLSALSQATEHIGLVATGSTTFDAPYHIARRFASLDWLSNGRAGWNIVTTSNPDAALNFGLDEHMEHGERYRRAREFYDVVTGLWDSWADDAWVRDVDDGIFFEPSKMHVLNHKGKYYSVRGPVNIARPVQGWPVIVQAGASELRPPARRRDRGGGVHRAERSRGRAAVLRRREGPHGEAWPRRAST